jgi:trimethylamine--corrinoid protein Co-methyltransferase
VGRHLGLPTQAYTATSESKQLDAQAGAETWASVLNAAMAGLHLVSGPGMLDYLLTFHLPKLVFDNEVCGQVFAYLRPVEVREDLPTLAMVAHELAEGHMLTAPHTLKHWPEQLYLPGPIWDRMNLEGWQRTGSKTLQERAIAEVEARLAAYQPPPTDPALVVEMRRILTAGLGEIPLPEVPPPPPPVPGRSRSPRRERRTAA